MYGASANMVISLGQGVNGYTLDNVRCALFRNREHELTEWCSAGYRRVHPHPPQHPHPQPWKDLLVQRGQRTLLPRVRQFSLWNRQQLILIFAGPSRSTSTRLSTLPTASPVRRSALPCALVPYAASITDSARYIGSMVADVHRTLLYGGIFAWVPSPFFRPLSAHALLFPATPRTRRASRASSVSSTRASPWRSSSSRCVSSSAPSSCLANDTMTRLEESLPRELVASSISSLPRSTSVSPSRWARGTMLRISSVSTSRGRLWLDANELVVPVESSRAASCSDQVQSSSNTRVDSRSPRC